MSKSDNAKDEIMTEQPLEENEKQHSASDKEDTGKKKTDGRQVKAAINVIRKKVKAPSAQVFLLKATTLSSQVFLLKETTHFAQMPPSPSFRKRFSFPDVFVVQS